MFGIMETRTALGAILAHKVSAEGRTFQKGHKLTRENLSFLGSLGISQVTAHRIEPDEVDEENAADLVSRAIGAEHMRIAPAVGGRMNFYSQADGLFIADKKLVDIFNSIDHAITFASLPDRISVKAGEMIATVKIIPLAVSRSAVEAAASVAGIGCMIKVMPFRRYTASLIATQLPSLSEKTMSKTARILGIRLMERNSLLLSETRVAHSADAVAAALKVEIETRPPGDHMIVIFGASAVVDNNDVIPEAIRLAGGAVERVGMPVDPGNLLVLGRVGDIPVIGAPGCARSSSENGLDWVLDRLIAGDHLDGLEISRMGVGGLLKEISARPQLREQPVRGAHFLDRDAVSA
ncbi:molybdopterin-binding protein [Rhizobium ruizarguesonis]|uniref:Molybdopterin molybdenumtransferase n=1 Tax=Rhizobium ruizarguesonis TaxID=2081791 RepID=A0ABY1X0Q1_9HYPH|nr:molybdopterin-binding protein [Rhizobium ruizarguesonis]NEI15400.1 hypothetical protein [Rhizobium ruizarguesonis]TAX67661.1 hypothetical protein ELH98_30545 [Rhizobium ruizarguesonis]